MFCWTNRQSWLTKKKLQIIVTVLAALMLISLYLGNDTRGTRLLKNASRNSCAICRMVNGIVTATHACATQGCHFEWSWAILSNFAKYSTTRSIARPLCDSWDSSTVMLQLQHKRRNNKETNAGNRKTSPAVAGRNNKSRHATQISTVCYNSTQWTGYSCSPTHNQT